MTISRLILREYPQHRFSLLQKRSEINWRHIKVRRDSTNYRYRQYGMEARADLYKQRLSRYVRDANSWDWAIKAT